MSTDFSQYDALREAAWLEGPWRIKEMQFRPFTLGSYILGRQMGLTIVARLGEIEGLSADRVLFESSAFLWAQFAPIDDILHHVREGTWADVDFAELLCEGGLDLTTLEDCAEVLMFLRRQHEMINAAKYKPVRVDTLKKPLSKSEALEWNAHYVPSIIACVCQAVPALTKDQVLWELPYVQALQIEHRVAREKGYKTVRPMEKAEVEQKVQQLEQVVQSVAVEDDEW